MKTSDSSIALTAFSDPDFSRLSELAKTTYSGRDITDRDYLFWEYNQNPDGKAILTVAEKQNEIISQYVLLPKVFSVNNKLYQGSLSVNTLTHPAYKGQGLFPALAENCFKICADSGIDFTIGFPNANSFPTFINKIHFTSLGRLAILVKPLWSKHLLLNLFKGQINKSDTDIPVHLDVNLHSNRNGIEISELDLLKDKLVYSDFLTKFLSEKVNCKVRSLEYLKWRYADIPRRKYLMIKVVHEEKMLAFAVIRMKYLFGFRCGLLIDFCTINHSSQILATNELFRTIKNFFKSNRLNFCFTAMQPYNQEYSLLKENGFYRIPEKILPQQPEFILKVHKEVKDSNSLSDFKNWFLTFGDYDIF